MESWVLVEKSYFCKVLQLHHLKEVLHCLFCIFQVAKLCFLHHYSYCQVLYMCY